jgi:hypothetical protein
VHTIKAKLDKDIAYIERMEKNIQQVLSKKKRELQFTKQVNQRLQIDLQRVPSTLYSESGSSSSIAIPSKTATRKPASGRSSPREGSKKPKS